MHMMKMESDTTNPYLEPKFEAHWYDPNTIGAGPYRFVSFDPSVKIELERDPRYPLGGNAYSKILFQIVTEDLQRVRKMKERGATLHRSLPFSIQNRSTGSR